jgi:TrpR-related protein YerC/YecD
MAKRLTAARMLNNIYIYSEIAEQTGLSTATISRVNRCLKYGSDGYAAILPRIERKK